MIHYKNEKEVKINEKKRFKSRKKEYTFENLTKDTEWEEISTRNVYLMDGTFVNVKDNFSETHNRDYDICYSVEIPEFTQKSKTNAYMYDCVPNELIDDIIIERMVELDVATFHLNDENEIKFSMGNKGGRIASYKGEIGEFKEYYVGNHCYHHIVIGELNTFIQKHGGIDKEQSIIKNLERKSNREELEPKQNYLLREANKVRVARAQKECEELEKKAVEAQGQNPDEVK